MISRLPIEMEFTGITTNSQKITISGNIFASCLCIFADLCKFVPIKFDWLGLKNICDKLLICFERSNKKIMV